MDTGAFVYSWQFNPVDFIGFTAPDGTVLLRLFFKARSSNGQASVQITGNPAMLEGMNDGFEELSVVPINNVSVGVTRPSGTAGPDPTAIVGDLSAFLSYSDTSGGVNAYAIAFDADAVLAGFSPSISGMLPSGDIEIPLPMGLAVGTYKADLTVLNNLNGCSSVPDTFDIVVSSTEPLRLSLEVIGSDALQCGDTTVVAVRAAADHPGLYAIQFSMNWDAGVLSFVEDSVFTVGGGSAFGGDMDVVDGVFIYSWDSGVAGLVAIDSGDLLLKLIFLGSNANGQSLVVISGNPSPMEATGDSFDNVGIVPVNNVSVDVARPTLTAGPDPTAIMGDMSAFLSYSDTSGGVDAYAIAFDADAVLAGFSPSISGMLPSGDIEIPLPMGLAVGTYKADLTVLNNLNGCSSVPDTFDIVVSSTEPLRLSLEVIGSDALQCGDTTVVAVRAAADHPGLYAIQFSMNWDAGVLAISGDTSYTLGGEMPVVNADNSTGVFIYSWGLVASIIPVALDSGDLLMTLLFTGKNTTGTSTISITGQPEPMEAIGPAFDDVGLIAVNQVSIASEAVEVAFGPDPAVCQQEGFAFISYQVISGVPSRYHIAFDQDALDAGFVDAAASFLPSDSIVIPFPPMVAPGRYSGVVWTDNGKSGCESSNHPFSIEIVGIPVVEDDSIVVCRDSPIGYILQTTATSFPTNAYALISVVADPALVPGIGNAVPGTCQPADVIQNDSWKNPTANLLLVEYLIRPLTGCGVLPECSEDTARIVVAVKGIPVPACPSSVTLPTSTDDFYDCVVDIDLNHPDLADGCPSVLLSIDFSSGTPAPVSIPMGGTVNQGGANTYTFHLGETVVQYTATDQGGTTTSCTFSIAIVDDEEPELTCPDSIVVPARPATCFVYGQDIAMPTAQDNCGTPTITSDIPFQLFVGATMVTYTATDQSLNSAQCTVRVVVADTQMPTITCPADVSVQTDPGQCTSSAVPLGTALGNDNCPGAQVASNAPLVYPIGITTVRYTITDASGNTATCETRVTVVDQEAPQMVCPLNMTVEADADCRATGVMVGSPVATDNCGISSVVNNAPLVYLLGQTIVTFTAVDASGNSSTCIVGITVVDVTPPSIVCPGDLTVSAAPGTCTASSVVTGMAVATDNCAVSGITTDAPLIFDAGITVIVYTAEDGSGNTATCVQRVTVLDQVPPMVVCPPAVTLNTDPASCASTASTGAATASDNCGLSSLVDNRPPTFPLGLTQVLFTATDMQGNTATCIQVVTVLDQELPVITGCPSSVTASTDPGLCTGTVSWVVPQASDNCSVVAFNGTYSPGLSFMIGTTIVVYTARDASGNTATCSFVLNVVDTEAPRLTNCSSDITVNNASNACGAIVSWTPPQGSDNCMGAMLTTNHLPGAFFGLGQTVVFYTASDAAGNTATCTFRVNVLEQQPPNVVCPPDIQLQVPDDACTVVADWTIPVPTDNCPGASITFASHVPGSGFPVGTTVVTYIASDVSGQTASCSFSVVVRDNTVPVANCVPSFALNLDANGQAVVTAGQIDAGSTDNCGIQTVAVQPQLFTCHDVGVAQVSLTVTDASGNASSCSAVVEVIASAACALPNISNRGGAVVPEPCACLGSGQFEEEIVIGPSAPGQAWRVSATDLLDPATMQPFTAGTLFTEIPDGAGSSRYVLRGIHVDGQGYTLSAVSPFYGSSALDISNTCRYPAITLTMSETGPFCDYSPDVVFTGTNVDGVGGSGLFFLDSLMTLPVTQLGNNWRTTLRIRNLEPGIHTVRFVFNAGSPAGSLPPSDVGCASEVLIEFEVADTVRQLACNPLTTLVLDAGCTAFAEPFDVLATPITCQDDFSVMMFVVDSVNTALGNFVTITEIGKTIRVTVTSLVDPSVQCVGFAEVVDQTPPQVFCTDVAVPCVLQDVTPAALSALNVAFASPIALDNCSGTVDLSYEDQFTDLGCSGIINGRDDVSAYVRRTWTARDVYGNTAQCAQYVYLQRLPVSSVQFPGTATVACGTVPDISATGVPFISFGGQVFPIWPGSGACEYAVSFTDQLFSGAACAADTVRRTWQLIGQCEPTGAQNPRLFTQLMLFKDEQGPTFACPADIQVNANLNQCCGNINLPDVLVADACSEIRLGRAFIRRLDPATGNTVLVQTVAGSLTDFPGNNTADPDTLVSFGTTSCLEVGVYTVTYVVEDVCGNASACTYNMTIVDNTLPQAVCIDMLTVVLGPGSSVGLPVDTFDNGSTDNCLQPTLRARRLSSVACQDIDQVYTDVLFCCEDAGSIVLVELRVYDIPVPSGPVNVQFGVGNYATCIVPVTVRDTTAPICLAPADTTVSCLLYTPDLAAFPAVVATDDCCLAGVDETLDLTQFDTLCRQGIVERVFRVEDCDNNVRTCRQTITFVHEQSYFVRFPDDVVASSCGIGLVLGEPEFLSSGCEQMEVSYADVTVQGSGGNCSRVERTWRITNRCSFDPQVPLTVVPNPQPLVDADAPGNLPGVVVSPFGTTGVWEPSVVAVSPGALATDYSQFWSAGSNGYIYTQYIWITDTVKPQLTNCPSGAVQVGDGSDNDAGLWNAPFWVDPVLMINDLCEASVPLSLDIVDNCSADLLAIRYELYLDLDGDGIQETLVKSDSLPGVNTIQYNNVSTGSVSGGVARAFDQRGLPLGEQFRFALERNNIGTDATVRVRWSTPAAPTSYVDPVLPHGTHRIVWMVQDACGLADTCSYTFTVRDTVLPDILCQDAVVNLSLSGVASIAVGAFLSSASDNCTPSGKLILGIRRVGSGTGFPVDPQGSAVGQLNLACADIGVVDVEIWVADAAINMTRCTASLSVLDPSGACNGTLFDIGGNIQTELNADFENARMTVSGMASSGFTYQGSAITGTDGNYGWLDLAPAGSRYTVTPFANDNATNGVVTSDLLLIQRHILQISPLSTPYRIIAADANRSGTVTGADIVELRRLILGITTALSVNTSWRFVDKSWVFPDPTNPFTPVFPETITVDPVTQDELALDFVAVKVGDVNANAMPSNLLSADDRTAGTVVFDVDVLSDGVDGQAVRAGQEVAIRIRPREVLEGYQFTIHHQGLKLIELIPEDAMSLDHFGVFPDQSAITTSWDGEEGGGVFVLRLLADQSLRLDDAVRVSGMITLAQAYPKVTDQPRDIAFAFGRSDVAPTRPFELYQNFPNPFAGRTRVGFYLPDATDVDLRVMDESGRLVYHRSGWFERGEHFVDLAAQELGPSGLLYYELITPSDHAVRTMIVVRR